MNNNYDKMMHDDELQNAFINSKIESSKLIGIPGGGKTKTIIDRIIYLRNNNFIAKSTEILVLTFSKKARDDFLNKSLIANNVIFNKNNVRTIHSISGTIVSTLLKRQTKSIEIIVLVAKKLIENSTKEQLGAIKDICDLKFVFVDEAQDISELYYDFVIAIKNKLNAYLTMIGDPNQNIYQFKNGSDKFLLNYNEKCYYLDTNYRSCNNIVRFINYFRPWKNLCPEMKCGDSSNTHANGMPFVYINNVFAIKNDMLREIRNYTGNLKNIAIIGPVKFAKYDKNTNAYKSIGLQLVANWLEINNIKYICHYSLANNNDENNVLEFVDDHVNLLTIHGCKGLEFDKVLIINFHHQTFSKNPTSEDYNAFEYMWYVALSRAKSELKIYVDINKKIFKKILEVPKELYISNRQINDTNFVFDDDKHILFRSVVDVINDKKIFSEEVFQYFADNFDIAYDEDNLYKITKVTDTNIFNGLFFEYIYMYYYAKYHACPCFDDTIRDIVDCINNVLNIPNKYIFTLRQLGFDKAFGSISINDIEPFKNMSAETKNLYDFFTDKIGSNKNTHTNKLSFFASNDVIEFDKDKITDICKNILNRQKIILNIFELTKFLYQYKTESKNLMTNYDSDVLLTLCYWVKKIKKYIKNEPCPSKLCYHTDARHPYLNICGEIDVVHDNVIIELKFVKDVSIKHVIQTILYYNNVNLSWDNKNIVFSIINLYNGTRRNYSIVPKVSQFNFMLYMAKITQLKLNNPIIIYDLETSGLDVNNADIIERHFQDYLTNSSVSSGLIKPARLISREIENITNITNNMLSNAEDIHKFKTEMRELFANSYNPIFIAHNGNVFDHVILKNKNIFPENYKSLLDSKLIIRFFTNIDTFKLNLGETFKIVCGKQKENAHRAFADVEMIIEIFQKLNILTTDILKLVTDTSAKLINS